MKVLPKHYPLAVAVALLAILTVTPALIIVARLGQINYIIDDAYIHLTLARNLATHGTWGIQPGEFSSASSSPLWTATLAGLLALGIAPAQWFPLILAGLSAAAALAIAYAVLTAAEISRPATLLILVACLFATPLTSLVFMGMEHALQLALFLAFGHSAARLLAGAGGSGERLCLMGLGVLLCGTRYEGLFVVAVVSLLLLLQGRWRLMLLLGTAGALPVVLFGLYSIAHGAGFFPNSLLMKGHFPELAPKALLRYLLLTQYDHLMLRPALLATAVLIAVTYLFATGRRRLYEYTRNWCLLWFGTLVLHLQFAATGWYQRYEAYLVGSGIIVLGVAWGPQLPEYITTGWHALRQHRARALPTGLMVVAAAFTLGQTYFGRAKTVAWCIPALSDAQYDRNFMAGLFLREHYAGEPVAICDLGATSWISDARLIDLWGLGTFEVTRAHRNRSFDARWAAEYCAAQGAEVAVLHQFFIDVELQCIPDGWTYVGAWQIETVEKPQTVCFFALAPEAAGPLARNLRGWAERLSPHARLALSPAAETLLANADALDEPELPHVPGRH